MKSRAQNSDMPTASRAIVAAPIAAPGNGGRDDRQSDGEKQPELRRDGETTDARIGSASGHEMRRAAALDAKPRSAMKAPSASAGSRSTGKACAHLRRSVVEIARNQIAGGDGAEQQTRQQIGGYERESC